MKNDRPRLSRLVLASAALLTAAVFPSTAADKNSWSTIERGHYLTQMGDCAACHTNDAGKPLAGNFPLPTPFGTIFSANLTPDDQTGLGRWSADDFYRAMNEGKRPGGARLYPAFPYTHFTLITREDSDAIFAYLKTLDPVRQDVKPPQFPFPLNERLAMIGWNMINFKDRSFVPDTEKSPAWNRGRYIAEGLGHCAMCHSTKNWMGAEETGADAYAGGMAEGWFAPPLRASLNGGLGDWSKEDIASFLRDGHNGRAIAFGPMAEVVEKSTSHLTDDDLTALATYLKDLPQDKNKNPPLRHAAVALDDPSMKSGKFIYNAQCAACHKQDGDGIPGMFSKLGGSGVATSDNATSLVKLILEGGQAVSTDEHPTAQAMPAFDWKLSDGQVAAVATYVRNAFGNAASPVSADTVKQQR